MAQPIATPPPAKPLDEDDPIEIDPEDLERVSQQSPARLDDWEAELGGGAAAATSINVFAGHRPTSRDAALQRWIVYMLIGLAVVIVIMVLFSMVRRLANRGGSSESPPAQTAPVEPAAEKAAPPPPAPPPPAPAPPPDPEVLRTPLPRRCTRATSTCRPSYDENSPACDRSRFPSPASRRRRSRGPRT